jgi:hypothetical protein
MRRFLALRNGSSTIAEDCLFVDTRFQLTYSHLLVYAHELQCMHRFPDSWIAATLNTTTNFTDGLAKSYKTLTSNVVPASLAVSNSK